MNENNSKDKECSIKSGLIKPKTFTREVEYTPVSAKFRLFLKRIGNLINN